MPMLMRIAERGLMDRSIKTDIASDMTWSSDLIIGLRYSHDIEWQGSRLVNCWNISLKWINGDFIN